MKNFFSLDFHMNNNDTELDNEEYVFVEFDDNDINHGNEDMDTDMDIDDASYDQCDDEELSLTPSTSASVCSETMFGDLGDISNNATSTSTTTLTSISASASASTSASTSTPSEEASKPRSCSIVSLHEEQIEEFQAKKDDTTNHENTTPMDTDMDSVTEPMTEPPKPITIKKKDQLEGGVDNSNVQQTGNATSRKSRKNDRKELQSTSTSTSDNTTSTSVISTTTSATAISTSRLSNKKRRKKMKQLKKAAALAAFTATSPTPKSPTHSVKQSKPNSSRLSMTKSSSRRVSNNIQVICATNTLASYREGLKEDLEMKKKIHGTLNFDIC